VALLKAARFSGENEALVAELQAVHGAMADKVRPWPQSAAVAADACGPCRLASPALGAALTDSAAADRGTKEPAATIQSNH
jgi:hypothetical protein